MVKVERQEEKSKNCCWKVPLFGRVGGPGRWSVAAGVQSGPRVCVSPRQLQGTQRPGCVCRIGGRRKRRSDGGEAKNSWNVKNVFLEGSERHEEIGTDG